MNLGCELHLDWMNVTINLSAVNNYAKQLVASRELRNEYKASWVLKAITCIDLTTLGGDDTHSNVARLCFKAARPVAEDLLNEIGFSYNDDESQIHTAAVCVYPSKVEDAVETLTKMGVEQKIKVASVATGFPSGQTPLGTRLNEIKYAIRKGAKEIDVVINRTLVLTGKWESLYQEIRFMKEACEYDRTGNDTPEAGDLDTNITLKVILATGELGTLDNVYKASMVAMMAGADFIKTSTGKEAVNATIPFGIVMSWAIKDYYRKTGYKVGLKPAGGVRTTKDALSWLVLIKEILGNDWLTPQLFRLGASGLLGDLECNLYEYVTGKYPAAYEFSM